MFWNFFKQGPQLLKHKEHSSIRLINISGPVVVTVVVVDRFYIVLFSAVEQTHCQSELIMPVLETIAQCNLLAALSLRDRLLHLYTKQPFIRARQTHCFVHPSKRKTTTTLFFRIISALNLDFYLLQHVHEHAPLVEFIYLVFTRMPGKSYPRRLRSLMLCLCDVFRALINSLVCWCSRVVPLSDLSGFRGQVLGAERSFPQQTEHRGGDVRTKLHSGQPFADGTGRLRQTSWQRWPIHPRERVSGLLRGETMLLG